MNQNNEEIRDPKVQSQPPPYAQNGPPQQPQVMQPTYNNMMPMRQTMPVGMGQTMHIGMGMGGLFVGSQMSPQPAPMKCPSCKEDIVTRVEPKSTLKTHMFAFMFLAMCCLPCILIPYCTNSCRNLDHYCPNCNAYIGTHVN